MKIKPFPMPFTNYALGFQIDKKLVGDDKIKKLMKRKNKLNKKRMMKDMKKIVDNLLFAVSCPCGCKKTFIPTRQWQRFLNKEHRQKYWNKIYSNKK